MSRNCLGTTQRMKTTWPNFNYIQGVCPINLKIKYAKLNCTDEILHSSILEKEIKLLWIRSDA